MTHQLRDAFFVATHEAVRAGQLAFGSRRPTPKKADEAEFIMLKDGVVSFEGNATRAARVVGSVHQGVSVVERTESCRARDRWPGPS